LFDSVLSDFEGIVGLARENPRLAHAFGVLCASLGDRERALGLFDTAIAVNPEYAEAHYSLGVLLSDMGRFAEAVDELSLARKAFPMTIHLARELGRALRGRGNVDEALAAYRAAIECSGREPDAYLLHQDLGRIYYDRRQYDESAAELEHALAQNPSDASLRVNLGAAYLAGGRLDEAAEAFRAALSIKSDLLSALRNLGTLYLQSQRFDDAVELLSRAVAAEPRDAKTLRRLALAYHGKGMEGEAERHMRSAIAIETAADGGGE